MEDEKKPIDVYDTAAEMLDVWSSIAWSKLGLTPDIMTGSLNVDLAQAKFAINVADFFAKGIEGKLEGDDLRRVQGLVRDLKMNYVQKSKEGT